MTYLDKRKDRQIGKISSLIGAFLVTVFILIQIFAPHIFSAVFTSIFSPFWRTEFAMVSGSLLSPSDLLRENEALKRELSEDTVKMSQTEYLDFENSELRAMLNKASSTPKILAAILARPPVSAYDELIIDIGKDKNLSSTSVVYIGGNVPIGKVTEVFGNTSRVTLFSSPSNKQDVLIGPSHIPATSVGRGGGQYEAELPMGSKVSVGDFVLPTGLDARPLGTVVSIDSNTANPFEKILFAPSINIFQLRWVLVDVSGSAKKK